MILVVGVGMGPQHVTPEAADALDRAAYVVAADKSGPGAPDPLLDLRRQVAAAHGLEVVAVADPPRDRAPSDYDGAVHDWHEARAAAYAEVVAARPGVPAFLVWGDPSLYDSTIRVARLVDDDVRVIPGVGAPQLLAARFGMVLHEVGRPVHVTTARRLREALAAGQTNIVVMLTSGPPPVVVPDDWQIWWGANLGTPSECLVRGPLGEVRAAIGQAREEARARAGWVMDTYLLRGTTEVDR